MNNAVAKPDCYKCKHRRDLAGDAHSRCAHPKAGGSGDQITDLALAFMGQGGTREGKVALGITGNEMGIRRGWFLWPANFDPVWLLTCTGFESKESVNAK